MSASLVGSEMCIRDRHWPEVRRGLHSIWMRLQPQKAPQGETFLSKACDCLLYTSDAADDM
eukprot:9461147-Alexandrium_andersonii.AAC.1